MRDIDELSPKKLNAKYAIKKADVMVLFGGSILCGGDILAKAINDNIAKTYIIVGGAGHTTNTLREKIHAARPEIETAGKPEAEIFSEYIKAVYNVAPDYIETKSTNCGNNIIYMLDLIAKNNIEFNSIILCQDATMQRRMDAGLRKYIDGSIKIINYAAYKTKVISKSNSEQGKATLAFEFEPHGMWNMDRYINLLMGEIPRLTDDRNGYGPNGKNYIAHTQVPQKVQKAFEQMQTEYGYGVRKAI